MRVHERELIHLRGSGIGSIFSNIFRGLVPFAQKLFHFGKRAAASESGQRVMKAAKKSALRAGIDISHDALQGKNIKASAKKNLKHLGRHLAADVGHELRRPKKRGRGGKKKSAKKGRSTGKKKVKKTGKCKKKAKRGKKPGVKRTTKKKINRQKKGGKAVGRRKNLIHLWT